MIEQPGSPEHWPPLGLPVGSVRALLTLFIVAVVVLNVARGQDLDVIWTETLLIALAHYFTSRRFVALPPETLKRLQQEGLVDRDVHPLYLPRSSIRFLILAAFIALGVYLYQHQRLLEARSLALLGVVGAYFCGMVVRGFSSWLGKRTNRPPSSRWGDIKALIVLLAVGAAGLPELLSVPDFLPPDMHRVALGLMLFYFGSR